MPLTPHQLKAARELLGWPRIRLAARIGTSETTIAFYESGRGLRVTLDLLLTRQVLEAAGVEFTTGENPGARLTAAALSPSSDFAQR